MGQSPQSRTPWSSDGPGGSALRRLFPTAVAGLAALSLLRWLGERAGLYGTGVGLLLMFCAASAVVGGLIWHFAAGLDRSDALLERQHRQLVDAQAVAGFGSWDADLENGTVVWSDGLFRLFGVEPRVDAMPFGAFMQRVHADDRAMVLEAYSGGDSFSFEHRILHEDGGERVLHARCEVVLDENGVLVAKLGTAQDITASRAAERAKDEFTSVVSHELRTPLTSIRGSLGLLESGVLGELPEKGRRMVEIAVQNTDRLVRLINDILDIERMTSGHVPMALDTCAARDLLVRAVEGLEQLAAEAGVTLDVGEGRASVSADPDRILQALTNLISNALKFSSEGGTVRVGCSAVAGGTRFEVIDQGRGIPADKLDSIFGRFQQVDASDSRDKGGTGLGLAICRTIVEGHGGRIWVESELGAGSTFAFVLPGGHEAELAAPDPLDDRPSVLVCDDDAAVVEVVSAMLEHRGLRAIPAHSGAQALERVVSDPPDAVLLDLLMPGMDGRAVVAALADRDVTRDIPVVVMSVHAAEEASRVREYVDGWVTKPIDETVLAAALQQALEPAR
ncbi:MAG: response regulator [Solirubrobacterales bacterium]|nr:response regulator [Solirubrobacterales bacterium]